MPDIKRLNYFNQQFLIEADFDDEQSYHLNMRRQHNRLLHTPGIAEGLQVLKTAPRKVKVTPGTALDSQGREIILLEESEVDLAATPSTSTANAVVFITIAYSEQESDPQPPPPATLVGNARITEKPTISASTTPPNNTVIQLARMTLDGSGNVPNAVGNSLDGGVRVLAGAALADDSVPVKKLKKTLTLSSDTTPLTLPAGQSRSFPVFTAPLSEQKSAFILVYAYSVTPGARFTWEQTYSTEGTAPNLNTVQTVTFRHSGANPIEVKYKIYVVLES